MCQLQYCRRQATLIFAIMKTQGQHSQKSVLPSEAAACHYKLLLAVIINPIHPETSRLISFLYIPFFPFTNIKERPKVFGSRLSGRTHFLRGWRGEARSLVMWHHQHTSHNLLMSPPPPHTLGLAGPLTSITNIWTTASTTSCPANQITKYIRAVKIFHQIFQTAKYFLLQGLQEGKIRVWNVLEIYPEYFLPLKHSAF